MVNGKKYRAGWGRGARTHLGSTNHKTNTVGAMLIKKDRGGHRKDTKGGKPTSFANREFPIRNRRPRRVREGTWGKVSIPPRVKEGKAMSTETRWYGKNRGNRVVVRRNKPP